MSRRAQKRSTLSRGRLIWANDRLRIQLDEAEARTVRLIEYVPLAIVVHMRTMAAFGTHWRQRLRPDLAAVAPHTAHPASVD